MYRITRISAEPASPIKIQVSRPEGADAGLTAGGVFLFEPGDQKEVDAYVASVIMGDPGMAKDFECLPEWKPVGARTPDQETLNDAVIMASAMLRDVPDVAPVAESPVKRSGANPPQRKRFE